MGLLPPVVLELKANAQELRAGMAEAGTELDKLEKHSASTGEKVSAALGKGFMIGGAAVTGVAAALEHLSQPIEQAKKQMEVAFTDAGFSADEFKGQISKTEAAMRNFGHSQSDTDQALQKLTQGLQDPKKALDDMGLAADLAAAKHISLSEAAGLLVKVNAGATKALKEFGIQAGAAGAATKAMATDTKAAEAADAAAATAKQHLADLQQRLGVSAAASTATQAKAVVAANEAVARATQHLTQLEEIQHSKKALTVSDTIAHENAVKALSDAHVKLDGVQHQTATSAALTVTQQQELRRAEEAVDAASKKAAEGHDKLSAAQMAVAEGAGSVSTNLDKLSQRIHGQAAAAVDTFGGRIDVLKVKLEDWVATHAQKLIPILTVTGPALMGVGAIIESGVVPAITKGIGAMGAMIGKAVAWSASMIAEAAVAAAGWVADMAVMTASAIAAGAAMLVPFLPIIAALAAVGVAAYLLYRNWDTVWGFIKDITGDVWHWLDDNVLHPIMRWFDTDIMGPIHLFEDVWSSTFRTVKAVVADVWNFVEPIFKNITRAVDDVTGVIGKVTSIEKSTIGKVGSFLGIHGATGGVVTQPTFALIGEAGPEAVIPLSQAPGAYPLGGGSSRGTGSQTVTIEVPLYIDGREVARAVSAPLVGELRQLALNGTDFASALRIA